MATAQSCAGSHAADPAAAPALAWWRGAYQINGLKIVKTTGKVPVPFLEAPLIDLAVSWHAPWHDHAVVAEVTFLRPQLNFVDGGSKQASQTGQGTNWREQLTKLLPITLNEVQVVEGVVHFHNLTSTPPVDLQATQVNASIYNLTNVSDEQGERVARFDVDAGVAIGGAAGRAGAGPWGLRWGRWCSRTT